METANAYWAHGQRGIPENWPRDAAGNPEAPALLATDAEGISTALTASMLQAYDIPVFLGYQRDGTFARVLLGGSAYGVGLLVPASMLEEAQALISAEPHDDDFDSQNSDSN